MRLVNNLALVVTLWRLLYTVAFFSGSININSNRGSTQSFGTNKPYQNFKVKQNFALNSIQIPNPFANNEQFELVAPTSSKLSGSSQDFSPEAMFAKAKAIIDSDLGLLSESLLDDDFIYIGPSFSQNVLGKEDYIAAGKFFDLR